MRLEWRRRSAALFAIPLALGFALVTGASAQAAGTYECEQVNYLATLPNTPLSGYGCTGEFDPDPTGGAVLEIPTGKFYICQTLIEGSGSVFGNYCEL